MIVTIDYVPGIDNPSSSTHRNVTDIQTIDMLGYKRLVLHMKDNVDITSLSTPAYLIQSIKVEEGD